MEQLAHEWLGRLDIYADQQTQIEQLLGEFYRYLLDQGKFSNS